MEKSKDGKSFKKASKPKDGRPDALTPETQEKIVNYIRLGLYVESAVVLSNISKVTFYAWVKKAHKQKTGKFRDFLNAVEKAFEEATLRDMKVIDDSIMGTKTIYERHPEGTKLPLRDERGRPVLYGEKHPEWGEPIMIDVSGQVVMDEKGKPVVLQQGIPPNWSASMWRLSKRKPKEWGSHIPVEKEEDESIPEDHNIKIEFVD